MIPTLHIHLLGDFLLVADDIPVTAVHTSRLQSLLAYLVLHRTAPQARSHLAFLMWPDLTDAQAHANLRKALHHLRQSLPSTDQFLHADRQSLHWQPSRPDASWTLDVLDFELALAQAEQAQKAQDMVVMKQALERAVDLYRGELLPGCYEEWILPERDRLHHLFTQVSERLIVLLEQQRDYDAAIRAAQRLLRHDALHEATYRQLMRFYALRGDRVAALRAYHTCVTLLERELAVEPSEATHQAYESLLQMDVTSPSKPSSIMSRGTVVPLVGREREWRHLQTIWRGAAHGSSHMVVLSGEAGIGKTKLAEELVTWVSRQGMTAVSTRCYAAEGRFGYAPVIAWLRADAIQPGLSALDDVWLTEVVRLVPELLAQRPDLPRPRPLTDGWQRHYMFEALAHAFLQTPDEGSEGHNSSRQSLLLLLDDMQWCDTETLEWVHYLLHFKHQARLLLIGTVRSEEILPGHPLVSFLGPLQREGLMTEIALGPLSSAETTSLAEHVVGRRLDPSVASDLYAETEGNPLFVVEMVRAGTVEQHRTATGGAEMPLPLLTRPASMLPPTIQTVLAARLAQLSPPARELAHLASVIGRAFSFAVLARATGESEESLMQGLDELWQRRIVREQGMGNDETYDFSHDKLREEAYAALSSVRRRVLHRRVAEALAEVHQGDLDGVSGQIAVHYERGGLPELAIPYYQRVGEVAQRIYANTEAVTAFQHAITLFEASPRRQEHVLHEQQWQQAVLLYENVGDICERTGQLQEARQAYQRALTYIPAQELLWQARLQRKNASTWQAGPASLEGTFHDRAHEGYKEVERILEQAPDRSSKEWLHEWIELQIDQLLPHRASVDEMTAVIESVQSVVEQHGTAEQRGQLFLAVVVRDVARDRYIISEQTVSYSRNALAAIQQTGIKGQIGFAHLALGICLLWSGHLDEAEEHLCAALRVGEQVGSATLLARSLTFLLFIYRQRGQVDDVRRTITSLMVVPAMRENSMITGHQAWVAWRDGDRGMVEMYGRTLLEERQHLQQSNSFYWAGLWPLIGVALAQEHIAEAMDCVRIKLDPTQQPPPETLKMLLDATLQAWDAEQYEKARSLMQQAVPLAEEMGYL